MLSRLVRIYHQFTSPTHKIIMATKSAFTTHVCANKIFSYIYITQERYKCTCIIYNIITKAIGRRSETADYPARTRTWPASVKDAADTHTHTR